jgi:hypothetical protein
MPNRKIVRKPPNPHTHRHDGIRRILLLFQGVLVGVIVSLFAGQFQAAIVILLVFAFALAVIAGFVRGL